MATTKVRPRNTSGRHNSTTVFVQKTKRRASSDIKRLKVRGSSVATVSSSGSEVNTCISEENEKRKFIKKCVSSSGSSGPERQKGKTSRIKPKKKLKSKSKKGKPSFEKRENPEMSNSKKTVSTDDGYIKAIDDIDNAFNETLRWNNICSDSEEEDERLRIYKENRRKRYVEAMHVKVAQRMSGLSQ